MYHLQGNIARAGYLHSLSLGFVRNFVGKNDHGIGVADLVDKITLVTADALEGMARFLGCGYVIFLQPVHAAYEGDAHIFAPCRVAAVATTVLG